MNPYQTGAPSGLIPSTSLRHNSSGFLRSVSSSQAQVPFLVNLLVQSDCPHWGEGLQILSARGRDELKWYSEENH